MDGLTKDNFQTIVLSPLWAIEIQKSHFVIEKIIMIITFYHNDQPWSRMKLTNQLISFFISEEDI